MNGDRVEREVDEDGRQIVDADEFMAEMAALRDIIGECIQVMVKLGNTIARLNKTMTTIEAKALPARDASGLVDTLGRLIGKIGAGK